MCDLCVLESVKDRMMSRRGLFKSAVGAAAAMTVGSAVGTRPALASAAQDVHDLTHTLSKDFPTFGGPSGYRPEQVANFAENGYNMFTLVIDEHTGTHIDAPLHFSADGASVDELPVGQLICPLAIIDIAEKAASDADAQLTPDDIKAWIAAHGPIPEGACVAMYSGWAEKVGTDLFRNADKDGVMHFPGFHIEATQMLLEETRAAAIAVDTLSLDYGASADFATHYAWLPAGRYGIECVANLDKLPATGATMIVGAPKHKGSTGGPARLMALV
ncbi:cyclase family protein [Phycobacter sp. K97]|uniref:cyclase family protein n=1 Tax=Phycobacter sedimenti TaxID=3133977 RepID=UPI00311FF811